MHRRIVEDALDRTRREPCLDPTRGRDAHDRRHAGCSSIGWGSTRCPMAPSATEERPRQGRLSCCGSPVCWRTKGERRTRARVTCCPTDELEELRAPQSDAACAPGPCGSDEPAVRDAREARREVRDRRCSARSGSELTSPKRSLENTLPEYAGFSRENHDRAALSRSRAARDGARARRPRDGDSRPSACWRRQDWRNAGSSGASCIFGTS